MKKKMLAGLATGFLMFGMVGMVNAAIININARTNTTTNPVVEYFTAGTYDVIPIGVEDGGTYNAWNAWGNVNLPHSGWINSYSLSSDEFDAYTVSDGVKYATDLLALGNAITTSFTLTSNRYVNFFISDNSYSDNIGGISLDVNPVPIPGAIWLLGSGIAGIVGIRLRRKKNSRNKTVLFFSLPFLH